MGNDAPEWAERGSGAPADRLYVDGPGCTPAAIAGREAARRVLRASGALQDLQDLAAGRIDLPSEEELARRIFAEDQEEDQEEDGEALIRPLTGFDLLVMNRYLSKSDEP